MPFDCSKRFVLIQQIPFLESQAPYTLFKARRILRQAMPSQISLTLCNGVAFNFPFETGSKKFGSSVKFCVYKPPKISKRTIGKAPTKMSKLLAIVALAVSGSLAAELVGPYAQCMSLVAKLVSSLTFPYRWRDWLRRRCK